jgi:putative ABC transport system substrate-binding protein
MRGLGIPAAFTPFSAGFFPDKESIARLAMESRVAAVDVSSGLAPAGGLLTFSSVMDLTRTMAEQLDKVLRGTPVRGIPFQQPTKFRLVVNRKTAAALGISLPAEVLLRADKVID